MATIKKLPNFDSVADNIAETGNFVHPSYMHGLWCGLICGGKHHSPKDWLALTFMQENTWSDLSQPQQRIFLSLAEATVEQMFDNTFQFELLLPDEDEVALSDCAHALSEWCKGMTTGLNGQSPPAEELLSEDAAEALADITAISELSSDVEDTEEDEKSYSEVVEFVRVAMLLIHQQLVSNQNDSSKNPPYLH